MARDKRTDLFNQWRKENARSKGLETEIQYLEYLVEARKREYAEVTLLLVQLTRELDECK